MKCAKSIDELYEEVSEYGLVITTDAALATALNARLDRAIVGHFAVTPKQIASYLGSRILGKPFLTELEVISAVSDMTGLGLKYVHSEVENIKEIRKYTMDVESNLHGNRAKRIYESYRELPTLDKIMGDFIPEENGNELYSDIPVAVIAEELFNDLDKHFIPIDHTPISIFKNADYSIDTIYELGNDRQIADNAVDMIDRDNPSDVAIVLNTASPIADAVRAALYRRNIPFINSLNVRDLSQIRDYLQFISLAMDFETIRVRNVKELFSNYQGFFPVGQDGFLLSKQDPGELKGKGPLLWETMRDIRDRTFGEVCEAICDSKSRIQVSMMLNELKVFGTRIKESILNEIVYAVDNVNELKHSEQIPDEEKKGVLLVDCNNSVYIDRPVVLYLGMEQDWNRPVVGKRYLDAEEETNNNVQKLTALIQQGSARYYFVNSTKGGKPARPSLLFDLVYGRPMGSFSDMCDNFVRGRWHEDSDGSMPSDPEMVPVADDCIHENFTKSSFNNYFACPRRFLFGQGLKTPEEKYTEFGNLIHAFAEYYVCYPQDVQDLGIDHFITLIGERYSGLSSPMMEELDNDKIRKAMTSLVRYIDTLGLPAAPLNIPLADKKHPNIFMVSMGKEMTSSMCESRLISKDYPIYGIADLLWNGIITDYKTSKPKSASNIAQGLTVDTRRPEFQPVIYLALLQTLDVPGDEFRLFYAMDNDIESSDKDFDIDRNTRTVKLIRGSIKDIVCGEDMARDLSREGGKGLSKKFRPFADAILGIISEMGSDDPADWDKDHALITNILDVTGLNDNKTNRGDAEKAVRKVASRIKADMVIIGDTVVIPLKTYEEVMGMVASKHKEMMERSRTSFPVNPEARCSECPFYPVCTEDSVHLEAEEVDDDE